MPPGEVTVTCSSCEYQLRLPTAAVRRDNFFCPQCGKNIPLAGVNTQTGDGSTIPARNKPRRNPRYAKRR